MNPLAPALATLDSIEGYEFRESMEVLTPALAIYPDLVDSNIAATLKLLAGDADRWRPHLKTAKLFGIMRQLVARGIRQAKCATTLELLTACQAGLEDVLVAFSVVGANARRVREIAERFPSTRISVLAENSRHLEGWPEGSIDIFIDINPGMNRTGIVPGRIEAILDLARTVLERGLKFRGLHSYEGHLKEPNMEKRLETAFRGYDQLLEVVRRMEEANLTVSEVITSGTPALPAAIAYPGFRNARFVHRVSSGTVVYNDCMSLAQLPVEYGYVSAVVVVSTVVSHPGPDRITCDAGHKAVSADAGVPSCAVLGRPDLKPLSPSEEHLPIEVPPGSVKPKIGEKLFLVPRHVCPTVNNFDRALMVRDHGVISVDAVTARGREGPLISTLPPRNDS